MVNKYAAIVYIRLNASTIKPKKWTLILRSTITDIKFVGTATTPTFRPNETDGSSAEGLTAKEGLLLSFDMRLIFGVVSCKNSSSIMSPAFTPSERFLTAEEEDPPAQRGLEVGEQGTRGASRSFEREGGGLARGMV